MSKYVNHMLTDNGVVIILDDDMIAVPGENPLFAKLTALLNDHDYDAIPGVVDRASYLKKYTRGSFSVNADGNILIGDEVLPRSMSKRLLRLIDADLPFEPVVNFWKNLGDAPGDLFAFLDKVGIPLLADGRFLCYKRVHKIGENEIGKDIWIHDENGEFVQVKAELGDLVDARTMTIRNNVGDKPFMERDKVDADRDTTCSSGLHVAAWTYAENWYTNGVLIECAVWPKDVVAIPTDYEQEKMRTCQYEVIRIAGKPRLEPLAYSVGDEVRYDDLALGKVLESVITEAKPGKHNTYDIRLLPGEGEDDVDEKDQVTVVDVEKGSLSWPQREYADDYDDYDDDYDYGAVADDVSRSAPADDDDDDEECEIIDEHCQGCGELAMNCQCDTDDQLAAIDTDADVQADKEEPEDEGLNDLRDSLSGVDDLLEDDEDE